MYNAFYTQKITQMSPCEFFYIALLLYSIPVIPFPRLPPSFGCLFSIFFFLGFEVLEFVVALYACVKHA